MAFTWPIDRSCLPPLPVVSDPPEPGEQEAYDIALAKRNIAEDQAARILHKLTGEQWGVEDQRVRPCPSRADWSDYTTIAPGVVAWMGDGYQILGCSCPGGCTLTSPGVIHLPGPVARVDRVVIAGIELPPEQWVSEGDRLYRRGGSWPSQHLGRPVNDPGTWYVDYGRGYPAPADVAPFVGKLAREMLLACSGDSGCELPPNVRVINRRGISYQVYDPTEIYASRKTGISAIDLWISGVNPYGLMRAPTVR